MLERHSISVGVRAPGAPGPWPAFCPPAFGRYSAAETLVGYDVADAFVVLVDWPQPYETFVALVGETLAVSLELQPATREDGVYGAELGDGYLWVETWTEDNRDDDPGEPPWYRAHAAGGANASAQIWRETPEALAFAERLYEAVRPRARRAWLTWEAETEIQPNGPAVPPCARCGGELVRDAEGQPPRCTACGAWFYPDDADYPRRLKDQWWLLRPKA